MAKLPNDFDWSKSRNHLELLSGFLRPQDVAVLAANKNEYLKETLNESPQVAIKRFIRDGALLDCELNECLAMTLTVAELKKMIKERGLKQTGAKSELVERLIDADRQGMENLVHNKRFMKCSDSAAELIKQYRAAKEEAFELAKRKSYEAFLIGDAKEAYKIFVTYQREFVSSNFDARPYQAKSLEFVLTSRPNILDSMHPNDLERLRAAICMEKLWYSSLAESWLPDDFETPLKSNKRSINLLKRNAEIHERLASCEGYDADQVRVVFDEYDVDSCEHCLALNGKTICLNEFPELPFENCTSESGCQCRIEGIYNSDDEADFEEEFYVDEDDNEYDENGTITDDITDLIERVELMETKVGIKLEGLFGSIQGPDSDNDYRIVVNGEIHAGNGEKIRNSIDLIMSAHDERGRVIGTTSSYISSDDFFCFEAFSFAVYCRVFKPVKIRIYPKIR